MPTDQDLEYILHEANNFKADEKVTLTYRWFDSNPSYEWFMIRRGDNSIFTQLPETNFIGNFNERYIAVGSIPSLLQQIEYSAEWQHKVDKLEGTLELWPLVIKTTSSPDFLDWLRKKVSSLEGMDLPLALSQYITDHNEYDRGDGLWKAE